MADNNDILKIIASIDLKATQANINAQLKKLRLDMLQLEAKLDKETKKNLNEQLKKLKLAAVGIDGKLNSKETKAQLKEQIKEISKNLNVDVSLNTSKTTSEAKQAADEAKKSFQGLNDIKLDTLQTRFKSVTAELMNMREKYSEIGKDSAKLSEWQGLLDASQVGQSSEQLANLNSHMQLFKKELQSGKNFSDQFSDALLNQVSAVALLNQGIRTLRSAINEVVLLDKSLTEFNKVTDLSADGLQRFIDRAYEAGGKIGRTGREVIDAATEFRKAGYTIEQSLELSKAALIMTNIGDGIGDVTHASSDLLAVLKGFRLSDSDVMTILDKINSVSNQSPIAFDDITEGLRRISGTLSQTGTSVDQSIALLTGAFSQLRNIEKSSQGLIIISQRIRGIGEDAEEIDGLAPKLKDEFGQIGIALEDAKGELRSTYDILSDYAKVYDTLSSKQKQYLNELMAGKHQVAVLNAIMLGWQDVENAIDQAADSVGSAQRENAIFMESVQGKLNALNSSWQELSTNLVDSDAIKFTIDLGKGLLDVANFADGTVGKILAIGLAIPVVKALGTAIKELAVIQNIGTNFKNMGKWLISPVGIATTAITGLVAGISMYNQQQEEARQKAIELGNAASQTADSITSLYTKFDELSKVTKKTTEQETEFKSIQEQLIPLLGSKAEALQGLTQGTKEYADALRGATIAELEDQRAKIQQGRQAAGEQVAKDANILGIGNTRGIDVSETLTPYANVVKDILADFAEIRSQGTTTFAPIRNDVQSIIGYYGQLNEAQKALSKEYARTNDEGILNSKIYKDIAVEINKLKPSVDSYINSLTQEIMLSEIINKGFPQTVDEYKSLKDSVFQATGANEYFKSSVHKLVDEAFPVFANSVSQVNDKVEETIASFHSLASALSEINNTPFEVQALYERLDLIKSQFDEGKISAYEYFDILNSEIQNLDFSNLGLAADEVEKLEAAFFASSVQEATQGLSDLFAAFDEGKISVSEYLDGFTSIANTVSLLTDLLQENGDKWTENGTIASSSLDEMQNTLSGAITTIDSYKDSIYSLGQILTGVAKQGSDEFTAHTQVIAADLMHIVNTSGIMANTIKNNLGTTTDEIAKSLTGSVTNQQIAAQAIAANTNAAIGNMANAVGTLFTELGNAISNFKVEMSFGIKSIEWDKVNILGADLPVPKVNFALEPTGNMQSTFSSIGGAVTNFGNSLKDSINLTKVELEDFYKTASDSYNPSPASIDNYNNALDNLKDSAGGAGKAAKDAAKEILESIKSIQSLTEKMLKQQYADQKEALKDSLDMAKEIADAEKKAENDSYKDSKKNIDKRKKDLQSLNKERKKSYDDAKKYEKSLFDKQKKNHDLRKKQIKEETDAYKERINLQIDALRKQEDTADYEKGLVERQNKVSSLVNKLASIEGDNSEATNKKRREWDKELVDARLELEEYQNKRSVEIQIEALNQEAENYEKSQQSKLDILESQWEIEQQQYETRLANIDAEYESWQEKYDFKMEALDAESERLQEDHEAELERIEATYNAEKNKLDKQIKDIDDYVKKDINIKLEAQKLINEKSEQFYKDLTKYAHEYTDMTNYEFQKLWNDAYSALELYGGKQIDIGQTLEILAQKMDTFTSKTNNAASSMNKLADAAERLAKAQGGANSSGYGTYTGAGSGMWQAEVRHDGGVVGETTPKTVNLSTPKKPNEIDVRAEKGEVILSNKKSVSDVQNALDYVEDAIPTNKMAAMLTDFLNKSDGIKNYANIPSSLNINTAMSNISDNMFSRNMGAFNNIKLEKLPIGGDTIEIDNSITVQGSVDAATWPGMKKTVEAAHKYIGEQTLKRDRALNKPNFGKMY